MGSFPYYSHTTPIRIPKDMGMVWEASHKGVPLLGVPEKFPYLRQGIVELHLLCKKNLRGISPTNKQRGKSSNVRGVM